MSFLTIVPPSGFHASIRSLNALPEALVFQIVYDCLDALFDKAAAPRADSYLELLVDASVSAAELQSAINAITHIFRSAQQQKVVSIAAGLESDLSLSASLIPLFSDAWSALTNEGVLVKKAQKNRSGPSATSAASLQVGKLLAMDWRLGLGVASDHCAELGAPFVTLQLKVADSFGQVSVKTMELSIAQFQSLAKNFNDIAARLDTV